VRPRFRAYASVLVLLLFFAAAGTLFAQQDSLPQPKGYVNDFAGVIDSRYSQEMDQLAQVVKKATGAEIAVATVSSIAPYASIDQYSIALAEKWGIGSKKDENGVLLILAMKERQVRIEVGYGLEGTITDGTSGAILDKYVLPDLKQGNYGAGLYKGMQAVSSLVAKHYDVNLSDYGVSAAPAASGSSGGGRGGGEFIFFILFFLIFGGGRFFWPLLFLGAGRRGFFGGGFGSHGGGGGGGFSGFGGGGFGGGGASRGF